METFVVKKGILNVALAAGANVLTDAAAGAFKGQTILCLNKATVPPVEILPVIPKGAAVSGIKQNSQAEVSQIAIAGRLTETIVASTRYRIEIYNGAKLENEAKEPYKFAYTSDAVLSGTAATDRLNVYTALMNKINAHGGVFATAALLYKVAYTIGDSFVPQVGEILTQATSGAKVMVAAVVQTSGTITGGDGAGTLYVYNLTTAAWSAVSKVLTGGTSGAVMTTAAALTGGEGIVITDDANYFAPRPQNWRGKSLVMLTQGFETSTVELGDVATVAVGVTTGLIAGLKGVYSVGIGTRMLQDVPVFFPAGYGIVSGEAWMEVNAAPVAGTTYRTFFIEVNEGASDTNMRNATPNTPYWFVLWVNEDSGDTIVDAFETALEASLGITFS
jgi:hypothetical protein